MYERPLLLSGARQGIIVEERGVFKRRDLILGAFLVLFSFVGAANILFGALAPRPSTASQENILHLQTAGVPLPVASLTPLSLLIPELGIDASVEHVGVNARGTMAVPSSYGTVAWYKEGTKPGDIGNAVIAGHLDNSLGLSGIFESLNRLTIGDTLSVAGENGERLTFVVKEIAVYKASEAPAQVIFGGDSTSRNLVLITCNGAWDGNARSYDKRLVVIAELQS